MLQSEVDRLVLLGATRLEVDADGTIVLADPDGTEFAVRRPGDRPGAVDPSPAADPLGR
jgi:hypothetical protein